MVKILTEEDKKLYQCEECGFHYRSRKWADRCEVWCRVHHSCNIEIITQAEENKLKKVPKILFVCAENTGRSQMAEAFFNRYAKEKNLEWIAESAGTIPAEKVNPKVIRVMREKGVDLISAKPKLFVPERINEYEKIISFGCLGKNAFSAGVQKRIKEWHIDDPSDKSQEEVRKIRDKIENKVINLIKSL